MKRPKLDISKIEKMISEETVISPRFLIRGFDEKFSKISMSLDYCPNEFVVSDLSALNQNANLMA